MADNKLDDLAQVRTRLVNERHKIALFLLNPSYKTESALSNLKQYTDAIHTLDEMINEAKDAQPSVYESHGLAGY